MAQVDNMIESGLMTKFFKKKKMTDYDLILLPYNDNTIHWLLIAIVSPNFLISDNKDQILNYAKRPYILVLDSESY